jgi:hypothetical protein
LNLVNYFCSFLVFGYGTPLFAIKHQVQFFFQVRIVEVDPNVECVNVNVVFKDQSIFAVTTPF